MVVSNSQRKALFAQLRAGSSRNLAKQAESRDFLIKLHDKRFADALEKEMGKDCSEERIKMGDSEFIKKYYQEEKE